MTMSGAESLIHTALACDVDVCFANPGTTEMSLVAALDSAPGVRGVLGLFEGVCTGAADGYGRMLGKPAMTLLHLGPGFANGLANLHNARRARSPIVNLVGDMATWHVAADAPLTSDIESLASPMSHWVRRNTSANTLARDTAEAIAAASTHPGNIATIIVPQDCQQQPADGPAAPVAATPPPAVSQDTIDAAAKQLRDGQPAALFLGGYALHEAGMRQAGRIAAATGCRLVTEGFPARMDRGAGLPCPERFPYFPEQGIAFLSDIKSLVYAGTRRPVSFFGYEGYPSVLVSDEHEEVFLSTAEEDVVGALEALADALGAPAAGEVAALQRPDRPTGGLDPDSIADAIAALQPENAIIMEEGATTGLFYYGRSATAAPHTFMTLTGGAIGQGPPCATGAAIACPDRPVINLEADGCCMYTIQSLWTQAREGLNVKTLICNNKSYRILQFELARAGVSDPGEQARRMMDLSGPVTDFVSLAKGFGVPGARVETAEDLTRELEGALREPGPYLIEMML